MDLCPTEWTINIRSEEQVVESVSGCRFKMVSCRGNLRNVLGPTRRAERISDSTGLINAAILVIFLQNAYEGYHVEDFAASA